MEIDKEELQDYVLGRLIAGVDEILRELVALENSQEDIERLSMLLDNLASLCPPVEVDCSHGRIQELQAFTASDKYNTRD